MRWLKREMWKAGVAIVGMLLLLVLMVWVPVSAAGTQEIASGLATVVTVTMQTTPTTDATVTTLNKEKLQQEVQQMKNQNDRSTVAWFWNSGGLLGSIVAALFAVAGVLWTTKVAQNKNLADSQAERTRRDEEQKRWLKNQEVEREKRAEERFQVVVEGFGSGREEAKVGAAIMLRTFLRPGYEQFYAQTFDLAVAHLRLPRTSPRSEDPDGIPHLLEDTKGPLPLTTLSQALIAVFKEVFPLARSLYPKGEQPLVARGIQLDNAYLEKADLENIWMPQASLRNIDLSEANLSEANLSEADLRCARISKADLRGTNLYGANLSKADLKESDLRRAKISNGLLYRADLWGVNLKNAELRNAVLSEADLGRADLTDVDFTGADLNGAELGGATLIRTNLFRAQLKEVRLPFADLSNANLNDADLSGTDLEGADLRGVNLVYANLSGADLVETNLGGADLRGANLSQTNLENVLSLQNTNLCGVTGLTKEQLAACKAKGAIIDEDPTTTTTSSSQSTATPSSPPQNNNEQASSTPPAQVNTPTPGTDGSSTTSSKPDSES